MSTGRVGLKDLPEHVTPLEMHQALGQTFRGQLGAGTKIKAWNARYSGFMYALLMYVQEPGFFERHARELLEGMLAETPGDRPDLDAIAGQFIEDFVGHVILRRMEGDHQRHGR